MVHPEGTFQITAVLEGLLNKVSPRPAFRLTDGRELGDADVLLQVEGEGVRESTALMVGKGEGQPGSTDKPVVPQAAGQVQGVGAPAPVGQNFPTGQRVQLLKA